LPSKQTSFNPSEFDISDNAVSNLSTLVKEMSKKMPKVKSSQEGIKKVTVRFTEPSDLALYDRLVAEAEADRRELGTYILMLLLDTYTPPTVEEEAEHQPITQTKAA